MAEDILSSVLSDRSLALLDLYDRYLLLDMLSSENTLHGDDLNGQGQYNSVYI